MNKYKIEFIFNDLNDLNDTLISVLKKEIKKYISNTREYNKYDI